MIKKLNPVPKKLIPPPREGGYQPTKDTGYILPCTGSFVIEYLIKEPTREEKIKKLIRECMSMGVAIPKEWIEEYNQSVKE